MIFSASTMAWLPLMNCTSPESLSDNDGDPIAASLNSQKEADWMAAYTVLWYCSRYIPSQKIANF